jgi:hypothetical protein
LTQASGQGLVEPLAASNVVAAGQHYCLMVWHKKKPEGLVFVSRLMLRRSERPIELSLKALLSQELEVQKNVPCG